MENKRLLQILKNLDGNHIHPLCIPVGNPIFCYLRPVTTAKERQNKNDVKCLTEWRNKFLKSFLTEFMATEETTSEWLANVVHNKDNKILFMLDDINRQTFGYMGLDYINWDMQKGEADAIVKGREIGKGVMKESILTMFRWGKEQLGLKTIDVRVLLDNPAINFYHKIGFVEYKRVPLLKKIFQNKVSWEEDESLTDGERYLVYLRFAEPNYS